MKRYVSYALGLLILFTACKKEKADDDTAQKERVILDTSYGSHALQKMDLYLPANRTAATKTLVLIHGGGWSEGSKADLTGGITSLKQLLPGYAFVNINYRLAGNGQSLFPTQEDDVKTAISFILNNQQLFGISNKLVVAGFSAGAHLALLHAYKNDAGKNVMAVVDFFGPTDLETLWSAGLVQQMILANVTGKIYPDGLALYKSSSPVNFVTAQSPPTLILQGGKDPLVPPSQSNELITLLEQKNVTHELVFYPNEVHGWQGETLTHSLQQIKSFLEKNVP